MGTKYKHAGPITSNTQSREFKRWVIILPDGEEMTINKKKYAEMFATLKLEQGEDVHLLEETVIRKIMSKQWKDDTFRIDITERLKKEILISKLP